MTLPFAVKVTDPTVTGLPLLETVAVNVVLLFGAVVNDGFWEDVRVVAVAALEATVTIKSQPLAIFQLSPETSSTTYSDQTPFGLAPLKTDAKVADPTVEGSRSTDPLAPAKDMCRKSSLRWSACKLCCFEWLRVCFEPGLEAWLRCCRLR